jgi:hypothetical protein
VASVSRSTRGKGRCASCLVRDPRYPARAGIAPPPPLRAWLCAKLGIACARSGRRGELFGIGDEVAALANPPGSGRRRLHRGREPADLGPDRWQGLFDHGHLQAGQSVLAHGAAGAVGTMVTQLAREAGAYVIGTGRAADRQKALDFGAQEFVDLENDALEDVGGVDLVFDVIGGDIGPQA